MRLLSRLLALLLSFAVLVGGVVLAVEVVAQRVGAGPVLVGWPALYRWADRTPWTAAGVRLTCAALAVLGLVLLALQVKPRRPGRLRLATADPATDAAITRRGLAQALRATVADIDGVRDVRVAVRRRRIRIRAVAAAGQPDGGVPIRDRVVEVAQARLDALRLLRAPRLAVRVATRRR